MALTHRQVEGVISLFATSFINCNNEGERKKMIVNFEDTFGKSIAEWQTKCREAICATTNREDAISSFDNILNKSEIDQSALYQIRMLEVEDLPQVRELINVTFGMGLYEEDDGKLNKFIQSGYSVVASYDDEICGVALAYEIPELSRCSLYLDTFAVAESLRGCGIGKKMLKHIQSICRKKGGHGVYKIKLQTDRKIETYQIYKHWGFGEDDLVHMHMYFL